jgi:hypothetical protein
MIDFPNTPIDGQTFYAPQNGVTYRWVAAQSLWLAMGGTTPGGDVSAYAPAPSVGASFTTVVFGTIISGNAGGWLATGTGRYTPPAGRYKLTASVWGYYSAAQTQMQVIIRKNGVNAYSGSTPIQSTQGANYYGQVDCDCILDANGTDWFDVQAVASSPGLSAASATFTAFPITGIQGPPGPPGGGWRVLSRQVVAAVASVDITNIPTDINDLEIRFDLVPVTADDTLRMMFYDGTGALITGANYNHGSMIVQGVMAANTAPLAYTSAAGINTSIVLNYYAAGNGVSNNAAYGIKGDASIYDIRDTTRTKAVNFRSVWMNNAVSSVNGGTGWGRVGSSSLLSGVRLFFGGGNIASGVFSVWGSP